MKYRGSTRWYIEKVSAYGGTYILHCKPLTIVYKGSHEWREGRKPLSKPIKVSKRLQNEFYLTLNSRTTLFYIHWLNMNKDIENGEVVSTAPEQLDEATVRVSVRGKSVLFTVPKHLRDDYK